MIPFVHLGSVDFVREGIVPSLKLPDDFQDTCKLYLDLVQSVEQVCSLCSVMGVRPHVSSWRTFSSALYWNFNGIFMALSSVISLLDWFFLFFTPLLILSFDNEFYKQG